MDKSAQRKRRSHGVRKSQFDVRSVDEITEEDLDNVAYRSKDKIWDKEKVCVCVSRGIAVTISHPLRVGYSLLRVCVCVVPAGQLLSPVQTEDAGHQDDLSQRVLRGRQGSVLRAVSEEPLRGGRLRRAAGPGQCGQNRTTAAFSQGSE